MNTLAIKSNRKELESHHGHAQELWIKSLRFFSNSTSHVDFEPAQSGKMSIRLLHRHKSTQRRPEKDPDRPICTTKLDRNQARHCVNELKNVMRGKTIQEQKPETDRNEIIFFLALETGGKFPCQ